tara:strand:- start:628 stop:864 length:237 start_codon:yes stop_codon:yes gene_type:complete
MNDPQEYEATTTSGTVVVEITFTIDKRPESIEEIEDIVISALEDTLKDEDVIIELQCADLSEDIEEPPGYNKEDDYDV